MYQLFSAAPMPPLPTANATSSIPGLQSASCNPYARVAPTAPLPTAPIPPPLPPLPPAGAPMAPPVPPGHPHMLFPAGRPPAPGFARLPLHRRPPVPSHAPLAVLMHTHAPPAPGGHPLTTFTPHPPRGPPGDPTGSAKAVSGAAAAPTAATGTQGASDPAAGVAHIGDADTVAPGHVPVERQLTAAESVLARLAVRPRGDSHAAPLAACALNCAPQALPLLRTQLCM